ncbi:N-acetylmuramoyl-L-alanine amidase [Vibrio sp. FNV 38]|nr:N-acetylmuramoyl-L-alanine amidase [Vibrio sp. FNV 38]
MKYLTLHCSATPPSMAVSAETIKCWHVAKGWSDIGYHWVIERCGALKAGRPLHRTGAHVRGHNHANIGVCLVGGVSEAFEPSNQYTQAQWQTLETLLVTLTHCYGLSPEAIRGHNEWNHRKACPCFDVRAYVDKLASIQPAASRSR